jgi:flavin-binding protein dodecin
MFEEHIYKVIEVIGTSEKSWEDAARHVIESAHKSLKDLRVAEVVSQDMKISEGQITMYRTKLKLSFKFHED